MTKKRVVKYLDSNILDGPVRVVIERLQKVADEYVDAEISYVREAEIEAWRDETDTEYDDRVAREAGIELAERARRRQVYEELKKEFEGA